MASPDIVHCASNKPNAQVEAFLRRPAFAPEAEAAATAVLADVRARGDKAVLAAARRFDKAALTLRELRVTDEELRAADRAVPQPRDKKDDEQVERAPRRAAPIAAERYVKVVAQPA